MLERFRAFTTRMLTPIAKLLLRLGVSPDAVTVVGTLGAAAGALIFFPRGSFVVGVLVVSVFIFSDLIDGSMARMSERSSAWGAFLDSTMDRIGDAAIFAGLALWYAGDGDNLGYAALALYCLVAGNLTSYARARAESLDMQAKVGIAERADRVVLTLLAAFVTGVLGRDEPVIAALAVLAVASTVTVLQRMRVVWQQAAGR
ncbi:MAG: CDP-alcohol phosphatidyltransferase family protein [Propionibacteriales bacterium]|nr:CDP-alcohol phosphatidyltransferase family protein [Propionibacteriales bacterium]